MALTTEQQDKIWAALMRAWSDARTPMSFLKTDLRQAVADTDAWIEANQASYNTALSQPFRGSASLDQKTLLFCFVALKRAGLTPPREE